VNVSALRFTRAARTALASVSLAADGEREFLFYCEPSADALFAPSDVDEAAIRATRVLHFGSISLIGEPSRSATLHAVELARRHGARISYDPNLRLALWPDAAAARAGLRLDLGQAQVVKIGEEEAHFLSGLRDPVEAARALWHETLELMAVTRGARGCVWVTRDAHGSVPAFAVEAVDTTGAGDAFVAGLLARVFEAPSIPTDPATVDAACRFACAVGAIAATARGAIPALPDRRAVEAFLASERK
jgi:fructokinase